MNLSQPPSQTKKRSISSVIFNTVGLLASIITIATIFTTSSIGTLLAWFAHAQSLIIPLAFFALGAGFSLVIFIIFNVRFSRAARSDSYRIVQVDDRNLYIDAVIKWVKLSKRSILLCVNTLKSAEEEENIKALQESLQASKVSGKDVKILAPKGIERVKAAYEITQIRGIPMKFLSSLEDDDFRFTVVDDDIVIISIGKRDTPSNGCVVINSVRLNSVLKRYSDDLWQKSNTVEYDTYLVEVISNLLDSSYPLTDVRLAERLGIPLAEVRRILPFVPKK